MPKIIFKISSKYIIEGIFDYIPLDKTLHLILYNKKLYNILNYDYHLLYYLERFKKIIKPSYQNIIKYIPIIKNEKNEDNSSNPILRDEKLFYKAIGLMENIPIDLTNKNWKLLFKNITNNKFEINPSLIYYFFDISEKDKKEVLDYLKTYKKNIKEISFNSFVEKEEINFEIFNKIKYILNHIFLSNTKKKKDNYYNGFYINKISLGDNLIISVFDINNLLIEIADILYNNYNSYYINQLYLNSNTAKNSINNINVFIKKRLPNLEYIKLDNFNFLNNKNNTSLSNLFIKLKYLNNVDLTGCTCDNNNLIELFNNNCEFELKELKFNILYGEKKINWNFMNKFVKSLEKLEINLKFPSNEPGMISLQICFNQQFTNTSDLFSIINKMKKLKELKLFGEYLNNNDLNFLNNDNLNNLEYSFYIINPELKNYYYKFVDPSIYKVFQFHKNLTKISLIYNYLEKNDVLIDKYNGIDLLSDFNRENAYKLAIFEFPPKLEVLKLENFNDKNFINFYLIPLIKKNKDNLKNIQEIRLNKCFLDINQFEEFLSLLPLIKNLQYLAFNNIQFYNKFKMINLISFIPVILKKANKLIELDISNNQYKDNIFTNKIFLEIRNSIPKNLISLKIFNNAIPISNKAFKSMKQCFGNILDFDNAVITNHV